MVSSKQTKKPTQQAGPLDAAARLVYEALETEMGGVEVYTTALECVQNDDLREEWEKYLDQTREHVEIVRDVCVQLGLDPDRDTPGRQVVRVIGKSLVKAMQMALGAGDPKAAEIVAAECVTLAETKDHANWELLGTLGEKATGKQKQVLERAASKVEDEEDEHLYHSEGWARELWFDALELPAQLPPPEEEEDVKTQEEAAQVKRKSMKERD
jgi:rubrerythrin